MAEAQTDLRLTGGPEAPVRARAAVTAHYSGRVDDSRLGDLLVLTSEVVTNAVLHGGAGPDEELGLGLGGAPRTVRVTVTDCRPDRVPRVLPQDLQTPGGLGLLLVDLLSDRWGVERHDHETKTVWFELTVTEPKREHARPSGLGCPGCGLHVYTVDAWTTLERCPRCRTPLSRSLASPGSTP